MRSKTLIAVVLFLALSGLVPSPAYADGIVVPEPPICPLDDIQGKCPPPPHPIPPSFDPLEIRYHHVTVKIENQVAVTHVDQVFFNPNDTTLEGDYIFPLPTEAAVTNFTLWVDGKPVQGQVLDADQARQKYEDIVRSQRDPALLEYSGRGAVTAHVFPIPAQGERRVELEYSQALTTDHGLVRYVYPLNTEKFSSKPLQEVSINVDIRSSQAIRAVYSPTHAVSVEKDGENHATAGYEDQNVLPDSDFALYYSIGDQGEAFHLLTYRNPNDPTDPDGFFLLLLAPGQNTRDASTPGNNTGNSSTPSPKAIAKDVILVLDRSGSMDGEKFQQAQSALKYVLNHLKAEDHFNVIAFSTGLQRFADGLRPAADAPEALRWVDQLDAQGSTDINRALLEAAGMADPERPTYLIFLTDGLPTEGVTETPQILKNFAQNAGKNLRLFAFGVGYDVDTVLLDSLAQAHHGATTYVRPGDQLDEILSAFYEKISTPVLTDLKLDFGSIETHDLYPSPLPDLFDGSQIVAVGRYRSGGTSTVTLTGQVNGELQTFQYPEQVFAAQSSDPSASLAALPRLWATRKIGSLLNQIRLNGPDQETIDQIVKLSIRYGIITPYTSYLVTDALPLGADSQARIAQDQFNQLQAMPAPATSGQSAVDKAANEQALAGASAPAAPPAEQQDLIRIVGTHTFVLSDGVWTDTRYDPKTMQTTRVAFLSKDYFALANARPDLAAALAIGEKVITVDGAKVYEVVASGETTAPIQIPTVVPTAASGASQATVPPLTRQTQSPSGSPTVASPAGSGQANPNQAVELIIGSFVFVGLMGLIGKKKGLF